MLILQHKTIKRQAEISFCTRSKEIKLIQPGEGCLVGVCGRHSENSIFSWSRISSLDRNGLELSSPSPSLSPSLRKKDLGLTLKSHGHLHFILGVRKSK